MGHWKETAAKKQAETLACIPSEWVAPRLLEDMREKGFVNARQYLDTIIPDNEVNITELTATELASKIAARELTSYEVCYAFCHRAALAHQILNCCIEIFFNKALERARELDNYMNTTGTVVGSLHGVPISLKDQVNLPGIETTIGYISKVGSKSEKVSLLARVLQDQGAIFYVKTAVPTAMLASETVSSLHGRTLNAVNIAFSSGGSSGGEGSLIGARGSPLGVGTDIGGSIRIPAAFQGLYGLRPSHGRIPYMHVANSYEGQELIPSVIGPLGTSLNDLELFTKSVIDAKTWNNDPQVIALPWRDCSDLKTRKLKIGIMTWDKIVMPHPPVLRALKETCDTLTRNGHEIVEWDVLDHKKLMEIGEKVYGADFYLEVEELLNRTGEPVSDYMRIARDIALQKGSQGDVLNVSQWWELSQEIRTLKQKFLENWRNTANSTSDGRPIDAILCPVWPSAGFGDGEVHYGCENYTVPFNILDCSCVVMPSSFVDKEKDNVGIEHTPQSAEDEKMQGYYNIDKFDNMPVSIQIVCRRLEEEKVLAIASIINECRGKSTLKQ